MNDKNKNLPAKKPLILQYLEMHKGQISAALPKHLSADRMARIITTEVRKVPKLLECDPKSLFGAVIQASQLGLEPGGALGHAYLVPFKNTKAKTTDVQLIIGYRGMIDLARRSGQITSLEAREVYEGDEFSYQYGLRSDLQHKPCEYSERGETTHFYAVAHMVGGGVQWEVMGRESVEKVRDESEAYKASKKFNFSTPWDKHFVEMAKKTVIRKLFKYLPVSIEVQRAVGIDESADAGVNQHNDSFIEGEFMDLGTDDESGNTESGSPEDPKSKTDAVKQKIKGG